MQAACDLTGCDSDSVEPSRHGQTRISDVAREDASQPDTVLARTDPLPNWVAGPSYLVAIALLFTLRVGREERMMLEAVGKDYEGYGRGPSVSSRASGDPRAVPWEER